MKRLLPLMPILMILVLSAGLLQSCSDDPPAAAPASVSAQGVAIDEQGFIVPNARIDVLTSDGSIAATGMTDEQGAFTLTSLPATDGGLTLRLSHSDFRNLAVDLRSLLDAAGANNPIVLQPMHLDSACARLTIGVSAIDPPGPMAGAEVKLFRNGVLVTTALTDPSGRVTFGFLMPGKYTIQVSKPGFGKVTRDQLIQFCDSMSLDMRLGPTTGTVKDSCCHGTLTITPRDSATNAIIDNVIIQIMQSNTIGRTIVNPPGMPAVFPNMCPGTYVIRLEKAGHPVQYMHVTMGCDQQASVTAFMRAKGPDPCCNGQLTIIAKDSVTNQMLDSIEVRLLSANSTVKGPVSTNNPAVFNGLCPGTYMVQIVRKGWPTRTLPVTMGCSEIKTVTVLMAKHAPDPCCNGQLTVLPMDSLSNSVLDSATVTLLQSATNAGRTIVKHPGMVPMFSGLCPGTYVIRVERKGYITKTMTVTMGCSEVRTVNVLLVHTMNTPCTQGVITMTVTDSRSKTPIPGVLVQLQANGIFIASQTTGNTGSVSFMNLGQGIYQVVVNRPGFPPRTITVALGCNQKMPMHTTY